MAANKERPFKDYTVPSQDEPHSSITPHTVEANNIKLKPSLLQIVQHNQFPGCPTKDPNLQLYVSLQYADTYKSNDVEHEAIQLCLFSIFPQG